MPLNNETGLKNIDAIDAHEVNHSMLLRQPPRPCACELKLQWHWFSNASERLPHHGFDQVQHAFANLAVGLQPVTQVFPALRG